MENARNLQDLPIDPATLGYLNCVGMQRGRIVLGTSGQGLHRAAKRHFETRMLDTFFWCIFSALRALDNSPLFHADTSRPM